MTHFSDMRICPLFPPHHLQANEELQHVYPHWFYVCHGLHFRQQQTKNRRNLQTGCSGLSVRDSPIESKIDLPKFRLSDTLFKSSLGGTATSGTCRFCHPPTVAGG